MKRATKIALAGAVTFFVVFGYGMFLFWVGGNEFVRGGYLEARLAFTTIVALVIAACVAAGAADYTK